MREGKAQQPHARDCHLHGSRADAAGRPELEVGPAAQPASQGLTTATVVTTARGIRNQMRVFLSRFFFFFLHFALTKLIFHAILCRHFELCSTVLYS